MNYSFTFYLIIHTYCFKKSMYLYLTQVIEKGPEAYGVIAPMEFVVNIAIYNDIAHMRVGHLDTSSSTEKAEIYYPRGEKEHDSLLVKDETFPELGKQF